MDINKVIEIGKEITKPDLPWYSEFTLGIWIFVIVGTIIAGVLFVWGIDNTGAFRPFVGMVLGVLCIVVFLNTCNNSDLKEEKIYKKEIKQWENEYVKPYIESIPKEKKEIIYIKIDPELSHEVEGRTWWGTGYTRSTVVERTPLVISYKDNGIKTRTNWYETFMELTDEEKPYIEYQYLNKNLGHGIEKGIYNAKVYLPESYTFTEIQ